jgi:hypothetical protein
MDTDMDTDKVDTDMDADMETEMDPRWVNKTLLYWFRRVNV